MNIILCHLNIIRRLIIVQHHPKIIHRLNIIQLMNQNMKNPNHREYMYLHHQETPCTSVLDHTPKRTIIQPAAVDYQNAAVKYGKLPNRKPSTWDDMPADIATKIKSEFNHYLYISI